MSLLKSMNIPAKVKSRIVRECDATMANDVAGGATSQPLMGANTMIKRINDASINKSKKKVAKKTIAETLNSKFVPAVDVGFVAPTRLNLKAAFASLSEADDATFDNTEVIAKLKGLENKEKGDARDTVTFGVQDDNEAVVRVTVRAEQAADFEKALQSIMAEMDEDENSKSEIAEVLYKLKDHFDIVDVVWPDVQEDEEAGDQQVGVSGGEPGAEGGEPGAEGDFDLGDAAGGEDIAGGTGGGADESDVKGLLAQVIDMMTADAGARKADAEARIADAKTREQEMGAKSSLAKIRQEEQFLDMDDQTKKQKEQEKEAKRLAQLSKWKHDMSGEGDVDATADEGSEMGLPSGNNYGNSNGGEYEEQEVSRRIRPSNVVSTADLARRITGGR